MHGDLSRARGVGRCARRELQVPQVGRGPTRSGTIWSRRRRGRAASTPHAPRRCVLDAAGVPRGGGIRTAPRVRVVDLVDVARRRHPDGPASSRRRPGGSQVSDSYELSSAPPDPIKVVSGRECATVGANLGPDFTSPGECLAAGRSECGNIIMWSEAYPSWGCHCCAPGKGVGGRENRHWDLYRGIFSPKKRFDELETAVHAWASKKAAAKKEYGPISTWDVSAIEEMSGLFSGTSFDDDISDWDARKPRDGFSIVRSTRPRRRRRRRRRSRA